MEIAKARPAPKQRTPVAADDSVAPQQCQPDTQDSGFNPQDCQETDINVLDHNYQVQSSRRKLNRMLDSAIDIFYCLFNIILIRNTVPKD